MPEARAILLGRMGKHEEALKIYVYRLQDYAAAESSVSFFFFLESCYLLLDINDMLLGTVLKRISRITMSFSSSSNSISVPLHRPPPNPSPDPSPDPDPHTYHQLSPSSPNTPPPSPPPPSSTSSPHLSPSPTSAHSL